MDFFKNLDLNFPQVQCLCRGMMTLAHSDGLHPREEVLIREFHDACRPAGGQTYDETLKTPFRMEEALEAFAQKEQRHLFVMTLWLLAFADGKITNPEREKIAEWSKAMGISAEDNVEIHSRARDFLLGKLAPHIRNVDALAQISKDMKLV